MYLLDANVFIQAKNLHYGFDFVPAFWDWLIRESEAGTVASIEKVADELRAGGDDLSDWAEARGERFFLAPDAPVIPALRQVSVWASGQDYDPAAISTFLKVADYWLSPMRWHTAISLFHMRYRPPRAGSKIPNACIGLGLRCITPYQMLRQEGARFVLAGTDHSL